MSKRRHDLLTPVNHIIGYSEILIEELEGELEGTGLERVHRLHSTARELPTLIQLALPAGQENGTGLQSLSILLEGPLELIRGEAEAILREPNEVLNRLKPDLQKILAAAEQLRALGTQALEIPIGVAEPPVSPALEPVARHAGGMSGHILLVDDNIANLELLGRRLEREGFRVSQVTSGRAALDLLGVEQYDLMLLDVMMPEKNGFQVLEEMQGSGLIGRIPVIMLSAMEEVQSAVRCIELGAEDYLTKPADPVLLRARIGACLEKKRLRDEETKTGEQLRAALIEVEEQRRLAESLLRNILPERISEELRAFGHVNPKYFDDVTIVFTDFVGFTLATESLAAEELVELLHDYFTEFDHIVRRYGLEKLKTIGDAYMFMGGLPPRNPSHPVDALLACFEIVHAVERRSAGGQGWGIRIGVHSGPVIAGVVGIDKFAFDVWGETVNYGARMESAGEAGRINVSERAFSRVKDFFQCEPRGPVLLKERKTMDMYFVNGIHPKLIGPNFARRYRTYFDRDVPAFPAFLLDAQP